MICRQDACFGTPHVVAPTLRLSPAKRVRLLDHSALALDHVLYGASVAGHNSNSPKLGSSGGSSFDTLQGRLHPRDARSVALKPGCCRTILPLTSSTWKRPASSADFRDLPFVRLMTACSRRGWYR